MIGEHGQVLVLDWGLARAERAAARSRLSLMSRAAVSGLLAM